MNVPETLAGPGSFVPNYEPGQILPPGKAPDVVGTPTQVDESDALLQIIANAARDPAVDVDKMQRLFDMRREIKLEAAKEAFNVALAEAQSEMQPVSVDCQNPQTRSKYASFFALDKAIRPIYTKHGFGISYDTDPGASRDADLMVLAYLSRGSYTRTYRIPMPADGKGARGGEVMTRTHATGSAFTYGRRYLLSGIFNIAIEKDDDANSAGRRAPPRPAANAMRAPSYDPHTGEILEDRSLADANPPVGGEPAGAAKASSPAGALTDWKMLDEFLKDAAEHGSTMLMNAWHSLTPAQQKMMNAAKNRRHKPRASEVDLQQGVKADEEATQEDHGAS